MTTGASRVRTSAGLYYFGKIRRSDWLPVQLHENQQTSRSILSQSSDSNDSMKGPSEDDTDRESYLDELDEVSSGGEAPCIQDDAAMLRIEEEDSIFMLMPNVYLHSPLKQFSCLIAHFLLLAKFVLTTNPF